MSKTLILLFFCIPFLAKAQTDLLILKKRGMQVHTYTVGDQLTMQTVYNQWFDGTITDMRHDSVYVNGLPFHYKEIAAIKVTHTSFGNTLLPAGMMVAGAGIFVLGAVNGLVRNDNSNSWYTTSGLITGAALLAGGFALTRTRLTNCRIGGRFQLDYLVLNPNKKEGASN
jgi:hypothetical protein